MGVRRANLRKLLLCGVQLSFSLFCASRADAQLNLSETQSSGWSGAQLGALGLLSAASLAVLTDPERISQARYSDAPDFEKSVERNNSEFTAHASDAAVVTTWVLPLASLYAARAGASYENSLIVYGQAMSASLLANSLTKQLVLRARPYTHRADHTPGRPDENYSFYSGHSALSFTAATSGSILLSTVEEDVRLRTGHFALSFALAGFTAHARVRAGRHYPTDVLVGSAVGMGIGLATPLLHGVRFEPAPGEVLGATGGLAGGVLLAMLFPNRSEKSMAAISPSIIPEQGGVLLAIRGHLR